MAIASARMESGLVRAVWIILGNVPKDVRHAADLVALSV